MSRRESKLLRCTILLLAAVTLPACESLLGIDGYEDRAPGAGTDTAANLPADDGTTPDPENTTTTKPKTATDGGTGSTVPTSKPGAIDFGAPPEGGPALDTKTCPALAMPMGAAGVYVDANALGAESGTKTAPFHTVAKAFASAAPKAIVWIAAGTYKENLVIPNKDLFVQGGFAPGFAKRTNACATVLEAKVPAQPVLSADDSVARFTLEGATVQKGARGIAVDGDYQGKATFTLARCVFSENGDVNQVGGAAMLANVNARVFGSVFKDNRAAKGAALSSGGAVTLTVDQNVFLRNIGYADHGGGLYIAAKTSKISRNTFRGNATGAGSVGHGWGGAVIVYKDGPGATNVAFSYNVFTENLAGIGGAVFIDDGAVATMSHDLFYRNRAYRENGYVRGAAIYVDGTGLGPAGASTLTAEYLTVVNNRYDEQGSLAAIVDAVGGNVYVEGQSKASFTSSVFWNNGDRGFYAEASSEVNVSYSAGASTCTSSDARGFITASSTICKMGSGVFLPTSTTIGFANEAGDDYHQLSTAGRYVNGAWVTDTTSSATIDKGDPGAGAASEPGPNGSRSNLGVYGGTMEASKSP